MKEIMQSLGFLIVLEGLDGCGKGTQAKRLHRRLKRKYPQREVILTYEPWNDCESGRLIRAILSKEVTDYPTGTGHIDHKAFQRLYVQNRIEHWTKVIWPVLVSGGIVICDRERMSTYAYGCAYGIPLKEIHEWHNLTALPQPDLILYLSTAPEECIRRMEADPKRKKADLFDKLDSLRKIEVGYEQAFDFRGLKHVAWIDNNGTMMETRNLINSVVGSYLDL